MTSITAQVLGNLVQTGMSAMLRWHDTLRRFIRNWDEQSAIAQLQNINDRLLRDAGIERCDLEWATRLPLSVSSKDALTSRLRRPGAAINQPTGERS